MCPVFGNVSPIQHVCIGGNLVFPANVLNLGTLHDMVGLETQYDQQVQGVDRIRFPARP